MHTGDRQCNNGPHADHADTAYPGHNQPYQAPPPALVIADPASYIQPWSGYVPQCTLHNQKNCSCLPVQTANIKVAQVYAGIEVESNQWIELACAAATRSVQAGGGPFAALVVQIDDATNTVLRYWIGHNQVVSTNDPTAHAEIGAIRRACRELGVFHLGRIDRAAARLPQSGATSHCEIYSSAEPCPMCFAAICWARIPALYFAATRYDAAQQGVAFSDETIYAELELPYRQRTMRIYQCTTPNSLDAFNLWKRSEKVPY